MRSLLVLLVTCLLRMDSSHISYLGPSKLLENEMQLLSDILEIIEYSDPQFRISICKNPENIIAHITPSDQQFRHDIINNLLFVNRKLRVPIKFSSSLHISKLISFTISLDSSLPSLSLQDKLHNNGN